MGILKQEHFRARLRAAPGPLAPLAALAVFFLLPARLLTTPDARAQELGASQAKNAKTQPTITTKVRQVLLDVVVADRKNHPVAGLRQEDFSILEDGKPQQVLSFEAHTYAVSRLADQFPSPPKLPTNTFRNASTPTDALPLNVLLYDVLNTPIDDQPFARREMTKFLKNRPPGSRYAIFVLSDRLHLLQGFTDDDDLLVSSLDRKEANTTTTLFPPASANDATLSDFLSDSGAVTGDQIEQVRVMDRLARMADNYFLARRIEKTVSAFSEISRFLGGWSGRKNLIWLSGGFPTSVLPGGEVLDPFAASVNYSPEIHEAVDRMTLSQVAVYPVDIRGLMVDPVWSAANSRNFREQGSFAQAMAKFALAVAADHATMDELAEGSGGHAFYNSNGLAQAIATAVEDGANYYTLSYSPTNKNFDGRLRKIRVNLARKGCSLSYRRSYFADDENSFLRKAARVPFAHLGGAMERGAPIGHEIVFQVHVAAEGAPAAATPAQVSELSQFAAFASRKDWGDLQIQRHFLDYWISSDQLNFAVSPDGSRHTKLELLAGAYDNEGIPMAGQLSTAEKSVPVEKFEKVRREALHGRQQFDVPSNAAWLRVAVRDPELNRVGTIEIRLPLRPESAETADRPAKN